MATIQGGLGNDVLVGTAASDVIAGGGGNDRLSGGAGFDIYRFERGFGVDTIVEQSGADGGAIQFAAGISEADLRFVRKPTTRLDTARDLHILVGDDAIIVEGFFTDDGVSAVPASRLDRIEFADGSTIPLNATLRYTGTAGDDTVLGSGLTDFLRGLSGDDRLIGGTGFDFYEFDEGFGNDVIVEERFADGGAIRYGDSILFEDVRLLRLANTDETSARDLRVVVGSDIIVVASFFTDGTDFGGTEGRLDRIEFADGRTLDLTKTLAYEGGNGADHILGGFPSDTLIGGRGNDVLEGGGGFDTYVFERGFGDDRIIEYDGANGGAIRFADGIAPRDVVLIRPPETATTSPGDLLIEVRGDTILVERFYNGDNDFASPQGRIGRLEFASGETFDLTGAVPLTATDAPQDIVGTIFADTIIGGRGDDRLMGGGGIDVYVFEPGFGNDEIVDYTGANGALIRFGGGIARADIALDRPADSPRTALISVGGDTIRIEEFFLANDSDATSGKIARIEIAGSGPHQPLGPIPVVTVFETVNARDDVLTVEGTRTTALYPLVNDTAPFGQSSMAIESLGIPNIGTVVLGADGAVLYRPPAGFTGVAQFSYTAGDGATGTDQAFVFLDIVEPKARNGMTGVAGADGLFDQQEIALLYEVSLGRAPDLPGLDFWINEVFDKARLTVSEIAQFFYESEEFAALLGTHPDSLSDAAYVEELYTNALDRGQPASVNDPDGYAFWLDVAATGVDRSSLMRFFAISGENVANAGYVDELVQEIEGSWTFG